ncbi:MAG: hypothetical protein BGO07_00870 [Alphaproteobacteria bacterium 40-19]|nr:MAG: hypothetical protein BGO07_00870 [Alphaproteobacteria bacterium 40-19]
MHFKLFLFAFAAFWIKDSQALSPDAANFAKILIDASGDASDLPEKIPSDAVTFAKILTETSAEDSPISSNKQQKEEKVSLRAAKKSPTLFWDNLWPSYSD